MWISLVSSKSDRNSRLGQRKTCGSGLGLDFENGLGDMKSDAWSRLCWCRCYGFWSTYSLECGAISCWLERVNVLWKWAVGWG